MSSHANTSNLVLKITRKRKRGAVEPWKYEYQPTASVEHTFRDLADFQYRPYNSKFVKENLNPFLSFSLNELKKVRISDEPENLEELDLMPPPVFSRTIHPHSYNYRQNTAVVAVASDGVVKFVNRQATTRLNPSAVQWGVDTIPTTPKVDERLQKPEVMEVVGILNSLLEKRPVWTRRALESHLNERQRLAIKAAIPQVAYLWISGPWRDACCKFGVDPRTAPEFGQYQTLMFHFQDKPVSFAARHRAGEEPIKIAENQSSHIFDGKTLNIAGRTFQLCDITDPLIRQLLDQSQPPSSPHGTFGWYTMDTMVKVRKIMRLKLKSLIDGRIPNDTEFTHILESRFDESKSETKEEALTANEEQNVEEKVEDLMKEFLAQSLEQESFGDINEEMSDFEVLVDSE
ncbi:Transcription factor tau subunit sfc1 [Neolecta irregularis DAH-3]|uniref:Transcription factor tau subunit sfc1 n=1 Tax=Neolecta irregularis (strain DAH-3) TaxID=1198029 RepID=A0A1U7LGR6_NEOID|nr:Transcription factor tau subunit sfc1 [Neolecta irregularis DAH-3]|eukprot:OLL21742.1 Transcription factor tau subunit sfc1 [Neolecta irregularis DAH-3]